jgi:transcriptional antiterminator NusG
LSSLGYEIISSISERNVIKNGKTIKQFRPIVSGYVFFSSEMEPDWRTIIGFKDIFYPLRYSDDSKCLRGYDIAFVHWLIRHNGVIGVSKAIQCGTRIKIVEGPLKEYEGNIIKVNKRQKSVMIQIDTEGIINTVWLSYEYIKEEMI